MRGDAGAETGEPGSVPGATTSSPSVSLLRARVVLREVAMAQKVSCVFEKRGGECAMDARVAPVETGPLPGLSGQSRRRKSQDLSLCFRWAWLVSARAALVAEESDR